MKTLIFAVIIGLIDFYDLAGQDLPSARFTFPSTPYSVCLQEPVKIDNASEHAIRYLWDLCPETFTETPATSPLTTIPGLSNGWGYKMINHNQQWTAFLLSRNTHKLFRLEFGVDPSSRPLIFDLGNPGNLLVSPQGLDIVKHNGNWFAFVGKGEAVTGQIVRLDFGADLHNTPTAVGLGTFGTSGRRLRDLKVIRQDANLVLTVLIDAQNELLRINYRDSFDNTISTEHISSTGALPDAGLVGFSIVKHDGNWILHTVSYANHGIKQYSFGTDIFSAPAAQGNFFFSSVTRPYYIKVIREADSYYGFVSNESKSISIIKFGSFESPPEELPNSSLPRLIGFDVFKSDSRNILQGSVTGTANLTQSVFEKVSCPSAETWSNEEIPLALTYHTPGIHNIELLVENESLQYDVASATINVSAHRSPAISVESDNKCVDSPVEFSVVTENPLVGWNWNLGDNTISTDPNPVHLYTSPGQYTVIVEVTDVNNCLNTRDYSIVIYPAPVADFLLPSAAVLCTNNDFTFVATTPDVYDGALTYQWYVDGDFAATERQLQHTFTTTGPKEIRLHTSIPGCSTEITKTTSIVEAGPVVDFSYAGICAGEPFRFSAKVSDPVESYLWNFGDGQTSTDPNPEQMFETSGDFSVSLTVTNSTGCENVRAKVITAQAVPVVDFDLPGPPNGCSGSSSLFENQTSQPDGMQITEWLWDFGDADDPNVETDINARHTFTRPGMYQVSLTATTSAGCTATFQKPVTIAASPSTEFTFTPACDDVPVKFSASVDDVANWYWEIENLYYVTPSPTHTFGNPGDYPIYLEITGSNQCSSAATRTIRVPVPLSPHFSFIRNCVNHETTLTDLTSGVDAPVLQEWNVAGGQYSTGNSVAYTFTEVGDKTISLKVTTSSGCSYQTQRTVEVLPSPVAAFSADPPTGAFPLEVQFLNTSTAATAYEWEFGDDSNGTSIERSPKYTFKDAGSYEVTLKVLNDQQCEDSLKVLIETAAPLPDIAIEIITAIPNPDGSWKLIMTLHNKGNTVLRDLPVDIDFQGTITLREIAQGPIMPSSKYNLVFNTGIQDVQAIRYVCAAIDLENDAVPDDNRVCREFDNSFLVFPGYPNPTTGIVNIEWISPVSGEVRITVMDAVGRQIRGSELKSAQGFNQVDADLTNLQPGVYYLHIDLGNSKSTQKILVSPQR